MSKKLSSRVRPGVFEARARSFMPVSALISDDLPTLERPAKAISAPVDGRQLVELGHAQHESMRAARTASRPALELVGVHSQPLNPRLLALQERQAVANIAEEIDLDALPLHDDTTAAGSTGDCSTPSR